MREKFIAGNWKMNNDIAAARAFMEAFCPLLEKDAEICDAVETGRLKIAVFPPFLSLSAAIASNTFPALIVGAQNCHSEKSGAYTGEVSADMLKELGVTHVIIGHSERRRLFGETNVFLNKKLSAAIASGLVPVYCVGETDEERAKGKAFAVLKKQLEEGLEELSLAPDKIIFAYEPVWAIGTGRTSTPENAREICAFIRETIKGIFGEAFADKVLILYGGSVNPENAKEIVAQPDIDGVLVGGASLKYEDFASICKAAV